MSYQSLGGYLINHISLLNGRLFNRMLAQQKDACYSSEQGKILSVLWLKEPQTATDIALATGLANNTLTNMLKRMEMQGFIYASSHPNDQRKKLFALTPLGKNQEKIGVAVSNQLNQVFYNGFTIEEKQRFEADLQRILHNLQHSEEKK